MSFSVQTDISPISKQLYMLLLFIFKSTMKCLSISAELNTGSSCYLKHPQYLQGISAAKEYHTDDRVPFLTLRTSHRLQRPVTQNPGRQSFVRSITFRSRNLTLKPTALPRQLSGHISEDPRPFNGREESHVS